MADMKKVYNRLIIINLYIDTKIIHQSNLAPIENKRLEIYAFFGQLYIELEK